MKREVSAIVLAGGYSSRMGQNKAELDFNGVSFLQHQVNKLWAVGIEDIVVSGCPSVPDGCRFVPDVYPHRGPLSGIHAGLLAIRNTCALVLAVDTPLVPEALLEELIRAHEAGITVVSCKGETEPLIGVYDRRMAQECEELLRGERTSLRALFHRTGISTLEYRGDQNRLANCNTPEEYRKMMETESKEQSDGRMEKDPVQSLRHDLRPGDGDRG